jgi:Fe2+ or Zn2+ uptake regulation protein
VNAPRAVARRTDPDTSREAADSLGDLTDLQIRVLNLLDEVGAATDEALVDAYEARFGQVSPSTVRTRRRELQDAGAVEVVAYGQTKGGHRCQVYRARASTPSLGL